MITQKYFDSLTYNIIGAAIEVHKALGPGLLESLYHKCLKREFLIRSLSYKSEFTIPVSYKGFDIETGLRCDFVVEDLIIVELKCIDTLAPVHDAQVLTYMKLLKKPKGILINFNCANLFREGQKTFVNSYFGQLPD